MIRSVFFSGYKLCFFSPNFSCNIAARYYLASNFHVLRRLCLLRSFKLNLSLYVSFRSEGGSGSETSQLFFVGKLQPKNSS